MSDKLMGIVACGIGGSYYVLVDGEQYVCNARGIFRKREIEPLAGDFVELTNVDEGKKTALIHQILPRKNSLARPKAANIDLVIITAAAVPKPNPALLDALLITCEAREMDAMLCFNKADLDTDELNELARGYEMAGYLVLMVSAKTGQGMDKLWEAMDGKTCIFAGSSGVGKSSLINAICPDQQMETGELSRRIDRGKHTTRQTRLIPVKSAFIIDSPGFSTLNVDGIPKEELQNHYPEFDEYKKSCYYLDCLHVSEHDCAVKEQVGATIDYGRYERYVRYVTKQE